MMQQGQKWSIKYKFAIPNLNIKKACFYFPAASTSTTNKFKDKMFLLVNGENFTPYSEKNKDPNNYSKYYK